jgi:hypothetical protein
MMNNLQESTTYDVESWITEVGWPTEKSDTIEALSLYIEWAELYPRDAITGVPHGDHLINNIRISMHRIHSKRDAIIITTLLTLKVGSLFKINWALYQG